MKIVSIYPGFEIYISTIDDGDFRDPDLRSDIYRPIKQAHATEVHILSEDTISKSFSGTDGIYTELHGKIIAGLCADCPVVVFMGEGECAVAHSGWRGTRMHIVKEVLAHMRTPYKNIKTYIGPHISRESYSVGPEFYGYFGPRYVTEYEGKLLFDIEKYILDDLISLGILEENISSKGEDTYSNESFYSYRRDGMIGVGCVGVKML